jgi:hypothetical protein
VVSADLSSIAGTVDVTLTAGERTFRLRALARASFAAGRAAPLVAMPPYGAVRAQLPQ